MPTSQEKHAFAQRLRRDPVWFCRRVLGASPWAKQRQILEAVRDHPGVYVPSCHASGKSFTAAHVALWALYAHPNSIVVTTAPTGRQGKQILWQEIRAVPLGGTLLKQELQIDEQWYAFEFSSDEPTNFSGLHADWVLFTVGEATGIPPEAEGDTSGSSRDHWASGRSVG